MKTQLEIEQENFEMSLDKARKEFYNDKSTGRLAETKGATNVLQHYKNALADELLAATDEAHNGKAVPRRIANKLIIALEPEVIAHYVVNSITNSTSSEVNLQTTVIQLSKILRREFFLSQAKKDDKQKFKFLTVMLSNRSYSPQKKLAISTKLVEKYQKIDKNSVKQDFDKLALYCIEYLSRVMPVIRGSQFDSLFEVKTLSHKDKKAIQKVVLKKWFVQYLLDNIANGNLVSSYNTPLVEKPIPWSNFTGGGFHTDRLKYKFISRGKKKDYIGVDMSKTYEAVNRLQNIPLRVNKRVLEVMEYCFENGLEVGDLPRISEVKRMPYPYEGVRYKEANAEQQKDIKSWVIATKESHDYHVSNTSKCLKVFRSLSEAKRFRDYPEIYFAYYVDYRGRMYPKASALSPQGDKFTKSLLEFAVGKEIVDMDSEMFFASHGANTFGEDKLSMIEKHKLILSMEEEIGQCVDDPYNPESIWHKADDPWNFLAFCFEWYDYRIYGKSFKSRLSVAMDGSCNGLQHLSAMFLDEVAGKAVNLTNSTSKGDIYTDVMNLTISLLKKSETGSKLVELGAVTRKACKKPVMTVPYAGTKMGTRDTIRVHLKDTGIIMKFKEEVRSAVIQEYTDALWLAIEMVIIKGREIMEFLRKCPTKILKVSDKKVITWTTPNGFKVVQRKPNLKKIQVNTLLGEFCGNRRVMVQLGYPTDKPETRKHGNSIAPNLIHSLDACHLQNTILAMPEDAQLNMIHDSYGTHASDCRALYEAIRVQFYEIYKNNDVLQKWIAQQPEFEHGELPTYGNLDLTEVLKSEYFFA